jgi:single-strand DNA-binding protein
MAGEPTITVVGRAGGDPELKYLNSGVAVANFSVAVTPRVKNKQTEQWEDGETQWFRATAWRDHAENIAAAVHKGTELLITGRQRLRTYEKNGATGTSLELDVEHVALLISTFAPKQSRGGSQRAQQDDWAANTAGYDDSTPF